MERIKRIKGIYQYDAGVVILIMTGRPALSIAVSNSFKSNKKFSPSFSAPPRSVPGYSSLTRESSAYVSRRILAPTPILTRKSVIRRQARRKRDVLYRCRQTHTIVAE